MGKVAETVVALKHRPFDILLIAFYAFFTFTTATTDYHNVLAPALGLTVPELAKGDVARPFNWPPQFVTDIYYEWGVTVDPLLIENPVFFQIMEWINNCFLAPGNIIMLFAFYFGNTQFRAFGLIHASALLYSMIPCLGLGLWGEVPASNKLQFTLIYSLYLTFPIAIIARLWPVCENLFTQEIVNSKNILHRLIDLFTIAHTIVFFGTVAVWVNEHWSFLTHLDYSPLALF